MYTILGGGDMETFEYRLILLRVPPDQRHPERDAWVKKQLLKPAPMLIIKVEEN